MFHLEVEIYSIKKFLYYLHLLSQRLTYKPEAYRLDLALEKFKIKNLFKIRNLKLKIKFLDYAR